MATSKLVMRKVFKIPNVKQIEWYPGHMDKSFKLMQRMIKSVDCIVEVHDARIPFSGRNQNFMKTLIGTKPHILILNKRDLIPIELWNTIKEQLIKKGNENVLLTECKSGERESFQKIMSLTTAVVKESIRYHRTYTNQLKMMIIGVPNVGKSSIINGLRNKFMNSRSSSPVGPNPGVTRAVQNHVKVSHDPPIYLVDTPGILPPRPQDLESGMKLALCKCVKQEIVGIPTKADFLLFWLNKTNNYSYVDWFELYKPTDDISELLTTIADRRGYFLKVKDVATNQMMEVRNLDLAAEKFLQHFEELKFGNILLDINKLETTK